MTLAEIVADITATTDMDTAITVTIAAGAEITMAGIARPISRVSHAAIAMGSTEIDAAPEDTKIPAIKKIKARG